ncbi:MAG: MFS transporter [Nitriliruptoraceae bacterium]
MTSADARAASTATTIAISVTACAFVLAALPFFLVGGLAVQIRADLDLSAAQIGSAVSAAFLVAAVSGPLGGRVADRIGPRRALVLGAAVSTFSLTGIATAAQGWPTLLTFLVIGGLAVALTDPGLAVLINRAVVPRLHGLAFGIKESAVPVASLIAGVTVPAIAVTLGWRWAFGVGLAFLVALAMLLPRVRTDLSGAHPQPTPRVAHETSGDTDAASSPSPATLVLIAVAASFGMTAAGGISVFLTQSAVAMGRSPSTAGVLLAVGSVAGVATRIVMGVVADRSGREQFGIIAMMLTLGAAAMLVGASGAPVLLTIGTLGVFSAGWGWSGLLLLSLVRALPHAPGRAGGVAVAGLASGTAFGPVVFGIVAETFSYARAWQMSAALTLVAAALMWGASRAMAPTRPRSRSAHPRSKRMWSAIPS